MKSDYIYTANNVYSNLNEFESIFKKEADVLSYVKCRLLRKEELQDFFVNGMEVCVYSIANGYSLFFDNYVMDIEVYDNQIINFKTLKS